MDEKIINEGLRSLDLREMVDNLFEVDTYKSKMGEDQDVCVVSFRVKDRAPARDLMEFIEKGYDFVLDSDVSSGENDQGEYWVFVEISRTPKLAENIKDIIYGVKRLTGLDEFKFKYHKKDSVYEVSTESLKSKIPSTPVDYQRFLGEMKTESIKKFFNKTLMDDLTLENDVITIHKHFDKKVQLRWLKEDDPQTVVEGNVNVDPEATAEIFWLTKVLGDYNISKFDDKLLFVNGDRAMLLQRI
jgi:hypothetical protein